MHAVFDKVIQYVGDAAAFIKPEYLLIGIPALLLVAFAVFALCKLGSAARKDAKALVEMTAKLNKKGFGEQDAKALMERFAGSPELTLAWKRYYASDTLTPFDAFRGKRKKTRTMGFGLTAALITLAGFVFAFFYSVSKDADIVAYNIDTATAIGIGLLFMLVAVALYWMFAAIARRQATLRQRAERAFADALNAAFPLQTKNAVKANCPASQPRTIQVEEPRAEAPSAPEAAEAEPEPAPSFEREEPVSLRAESAEPDPESGTVAVRTENGIDEIIRKINEVRTNGASIQTMQQIAMLLQKEREKKENKTVAQQRRLNEALADLLRAMSRYQK